MVSTVHDFILGEITSGKSKKEALDDLFVSYVAIALNELSNRKGQDQKAFADYVLSNLDDSKSLINNSLSFLTNDSLTLKANINLPEFQEAG